MHAECLRISIVPHSAFLKSGSQDGVAYSLITKKEVNFAGHLVTNLEGAKQIVPPPLLEIASQVRDIKPP